MLAFLDMGGYAAYVWPAYAVFFIVLLADYLAPVFRRRHVLRELHARMQRQKARQARRDGMPTHTDTDAHAIREHTTS